MIHREFSSTSNSDLLTVLIHQQFQVYWTVSTDCHNPLTVLIHLQIPCIIILVPSFNLPVFCSIQLYMEVKPTLDITAFICKRSMDVLVSISNIQQIKGQKMNIFIITRCQQQLHDHTGYVKNCSGACEVQFSHLNLIDCKANYYIKGLKTNCHTSLELGTR